MRTPEIGAGTRFLVALLVAAFVAGASVFVVGAPFAAETARVSTVRVTLKEFKVVPSPRTAHAGRVTFVVHDGGKLAHDFVVLKTNLPPGGLPTKGSRAREVGRVGKVPAFPAGQTRTLRLTLKRGKYVLICNVPGHYKAGMFVGFRAR